MTFDREGLKRWYREAMHRRLAELRGLRAPLREGDPAALDAARSVAQALRGSGATYGYADLSEAAGLVESAADADVSRRVEGLIEHLHGVAKGDESGRGTVWGEWLRVAAADGSEEFSPDGFPDLEAAWQEIAAGHGLDPRQLAGRVAEAFGLESADLSAPSRAALRLVPEALIRSDEVLPLREDSDTITVATADPTSLRLEEQLHRLTGRRPIFAVASPAELRMGIAAALDTGAVGQPASRTPTPEPTASPRAPRSTERPEVCGEDRVLVVDDDPEALLLASRLLRRGGYGVEEAGDGLQALDRLESDETISLVVADLNMPRLDGLELIWEIRGKEALSRIPVIVVTGETDEILETKLIEEGADDYIRKPLDPRLFLARVAATIRRAEH